MIEPRLIDAMTSQMGRAYEACVGRCMQNIAKYFRYVPPGEEQPYKSTYWAARKLAQLGQVNEETAQIIGMLVGDADRGLTEALNRVIAEAVDYAEPSLKKAVEGGFLANRPVPELTDSMAQVFESYYAQSADRMNLVNTVMLESTQQAYMQIVTDVNARMEAEQRLKATQEILNQETATVVSGVDTYNNAVRSAVQSMVSRGLSGFVDHAGHHWRPETYVAMDIRSTMANTARQATLQRCEDYGNDLIQVSSHSGARPLCYPWQGKILSTTDNERDIEDVDGNVVHVIGLHSTSYGQAAGLFGVNCGHFPTPFIPGFSALGDAAMRQDEEQNDKTYAESQTQRALERKMRDAKLDIDIARERGDPVALDAAKARAKAVSQQIDDFCDATGRARHRDREYTPVRASWPDVPPGQYRPPKPKPKPKRPPVNIKYGEPFEHYRAKNSRIDGYFNSAKAALDSAPESVQKVWSKAADKLKAPTIDGSIKGAHYSPNTGRTVYKTYTKAFEESTYQRENVVFFHEYGHNIDNIFGEWKKDKWFSEEYKGGIFRQTLIKECEQNVREYYLTTKGYKDEYDVLKAQQNGPGGMGIGSFVRQALRYKMPSSEYRALRSTLLDAGDDDSVLRPLYEKYLKSEGEAALRTALHSKDTGRDFCNHVKSRYSIYETSDVSDMFEPYTVEHWGITYPFGIGHGSKYARNTRNLPLEAFAEMYSALATNNDSLPVIKEFFPESFKLFGEMLEEIGK